MGYKRLPYIQTTGEQYINTNYYPSNHTRVILDFYNLATSTSVLLGSRDALNLNAFVLWTSASKTDEIKFDVGSQIFYIDQNVSKKLKITAKNDYILTNDVSVSFEPEEFSTNYPLCLFANNSGGTIDDRQAVGLFFGLKIYDETRLV